MKLREGCDQPFERRGGHLKRGGNGNRGVARFSHQKPGCIKIQDLIRCGGIQEHTYKGGSRKGGGQIKIWLGDFEKRNSQNFSEIRPLGGLWGGSAGKKCHS